jgi:hypothetical protein
MNVALRIVGLAMVVFVSVCFCYKSGTSYGKIEQINHLNDVVTHKFAKLNTYHKSSTGYLEIKNLLSRTQALLVAEKKSHVHKLAAEITLAVSAIVFAGTMFVSAAPLTALAATVALFSVGYLVFRKGYENSSQTRLANNSFNLDKDISELRNRVWPQSSPSPALPAKLSVKIDAVKGKVEAPAVEEVPVASVLVSNVPLKAPASVSPALVPAAQLAPASAKSSVGKPFVDVSCGIDEDYESEGYESEDYELEGYESEGSESDYDGEDECEPGLDSGYLPVPHPAFSTDDKTQN